MVTTLSLIISIASTSSAAPIGTTSEHTGSMLGDVGALRVSIDLRILKTFVTAERGLVAAEGSPSSQCSTTAGWSAAMVTLSADVRL